MDSTLVALSSCGYIAHWALCNPLLNASAVPNHHECSVLPCTSPPGTLKDLYVTLACVAGLLSLTDCLQSAGDCHQALLCCPSLPCLFCTALCDPSGTLKDLYVTLARVAGLPPLTAPGQQMVAAKLNTRFSSWTLNVLEDPSQRVSEMGRDSADEHLLVYYYRYAILVPSA